MNRGVEKVWHIIMVMCYNDVCFPTKKIMNIILWGEYFI